MNFSIRNLMKSDLPVVVLIEDHWNTFVKEDIDFGRLTVKNDWAIDAFDIGELNRTNAQLMVVELHGKVVGFFVFEKLTLNFDLQHLSFEPKLSPNELAAAIDEVIAFLKDKANKSSEAKLVVYHIRDRDEAHIREVLPRFMSSGFTVSLATDFFDGNVDAWKCTFESTQKGKSDDLELTCP